MRWLRRFFSSDDPLVKIAAGLNEPEAEMWRELLSNEGISAFTKNMSYLLTAYGGSGINNFDMWVKQTDLERAREILTPLLQPEQLLPEDDA